MELTKAPEVVLPALTSDEDSFALALIEYGGNLPAAYNAVFAPTDPEGKPIPVKDAGTKARRLLSRPEIAKRVAQLQEHAQEGAFISLGSHLDQMARLRDLASASGDFKSAITAEKARGEVAGYYVGKQQGKSEGEGRAAVHIHMNSTPPSVEEWAAKHGAGNAPLIIEMPK